MTEQFWMARALAEAGRAWELGEVPIGAVAVANGQLLARAHNRTIVDCDPAAHAELLLLRALGQKLGNHRFSGVSVFVTLEPCAMCLGALVQARVARIVFAAHDTRLGVCGSGGDMAHLPQFNHRFAEVKGGVLGEVSAEMLRAFFRAKRKPVAGRA